MDIEIRRNSPKKSEYEKSATHEFIRGLVTGLRAR